MPELFYMQNKLRKIFTSVRDIPYRIPLSENEPDRCCSGKAQLLFNQLCHAGFNVRYRVCFFYWNDLPIPTLILSYRNSIQSTHIYVEIKLDGKWHALDPIWDNGLEQTFHVTKELGELGIPCGAVLSPKESGKFVHSLWRAQIDGPKNRRFNMAFNAWLIKQRQKMESLGQTSNRRFGKKSTI